MCFVPILLFLFLVHSFVEFVSLLVHGIFFNVFCNVYWWGIGVIVQVVVFQSSEQQQNTGEKKKKKTPVLTKTSIQ